MAYDDINDLYNEDEEGATPESGENEHSDPNFESLYEDDDDDDPDNKGTEGEPNNEDEGEPGDTETEEEKEARITEEARVAALTDEEREAERVEGLTEEEVEQERRDALTDEEREAEDAEVERRANLTDEEREAEDEAAAAEAEAEAAAVNSSPVIEKFLAKFGVEGGMIEFEDGESDHISAFNEETQLKILDEIVKQQQETVEAKFGLSTDEVDVINKLRSEDGPSFEEVIESVIQERLAERELNSKFEGDVNYEEMGEDELFSLQLRNSLEEGEELTDEEIAEELELVKKSKSFKANAEVIRKNLIADREEKKTEWKNERKGEFKKQKDNEIQIIVNNVRDVADVAGWKVNDETKNEIIADLVELDEQGESAFTREVLKDPKKMFEAQWFMKHGADYFAKMDTHFKAKIAEAREQGKKEALAKKKTAPKVSATRTKDGKKVVTKSTTSKPKSIFSKGPQRVDSVDSLYED